MSEASPTGKSRRGWIFLLLRWAAAFAILALLLHFFPIAQLRDALSRVPPARFIAVLLIYLVALTGGITKWHVVVNSAGAYLKKPAVDITEAEWNHVIEGNLIGTVPDTREILSVPGVHLHLYGKAPRPGRKLGHVTLRADDANNFDERRRCLDSILPLAQLMD
jgi:hypothetical protein